MAVEAVFFGVCTKAMNPKLFRWLCKSQLILRLKLATSRKYLLMLFLFSGIG